MQTSTSIIHSEIDSFRSRGSIDARINGEISIDEGRIKPAARDAYYRIKAHLSGLKERLAMLMSQYESELAELDSEIVITKERLDSMSTASRFKVFLHYTLPGWTFVFGDIMFSKELIVKGWGLGGSGLYKSIEQWVLAVAIGLAPFFVKYVIDRFFEPNLENGSKNMKRLITGIYISLGLVVIFAFCQIAYVRGVFFRFMKTDTGEENLYNELFQFHSSSMYWAFILVALMFVIGGSFLLSISSKQNAKIRDKKTHEALLNNLKRRKEILQEGLADKTSELHEVKTLLMDWMNKDECIEHLEDELRYSYKNGFTKEILNKKESMDEINEIPEIVESPERFHHFTKYLVDKYSMKGKEKNYAN